MQSGRAGLGRQRIVHDLGQCVQRRFCGVFSYGEDGIFSFWAVHNLYSVHCIHAACMLGGSEWVVWLLGGLIDLYLP
jgi:hypothetical protein